MFRLQCNKMYQSMFYNYWKGWNTENIVKLISSSAQNAASVPGLGLRLRFNIQLQDQQTVSVQYRHTNTLIASINSKPSLD